MNEILFSVIMMIFSFFIFITSLNLPGSNWEPLGPGFFPKFISIGLFLLSAILLIQILIKNKKGKKIFNTDVFALENIKKLLIEKKVVIFSFIIFFLYIFLLEYLGFIIMSFIFLFVFQWLLDPKKFNFIKTILISIIVPVAIYFIFSNFLYIYLPSIIF